MYPSDGCEGVSNVPLQKHSIKHFFVTHMEASDIEPQCPKPPHGEASDIAYPHKSAAHTLLKNTLVSIFLFVF